MVVDCFNSRQGVDLVFSGNVNIKRRPIVSTNYQSELTCTSNQRLSLVI